MNVNGLYCRRAMPAAAFLFAVVVVGARYVSAHHSFAAEFDASAPVRLIGTVDKIEWVNPHVTIHVAVTESDGETIWAVEASAPAALARRGLRREALSPGIRVSIRGYRAKNGTPAIKGVDLILPDGRRLLLDVSKVTN